MKSWLRALGLGGETASKPKAPVQPTRAPRKRRTPLNAKQDVRELTLGAEQRAVLKVLEHSGDHVYITGKAGTGKSVLLQHFIQHTEKAAVVLAPTGVAALNIGGMTIHSFFKFPPDVLDPQDVRVDHRLKEILRHIDAVVIDEASMVRVDLMECINAKLKLARRSDEPFGGVQMILFGDLYQLPPVVTDGQLKRYFDHAYGGSYFFNAPVWETAPLRIFSLSHNFRQKQPKFRALLDAVRNGNCTKEQLAAINQRIAKNIPHSGLVILAGTNATVSDINHDRLAALPGEPRVYEADIFGDLKESAFPTERKLQLKPGAQVMMLKNDLKEPRRWANGTLGVVTKLSDEVIRVNIDGVEHAIRRESWKKIRYDYDHEKRVLKKETLSEFVQFPIRLAWAITIHKSQGQTYPSVAVDMSDGAFEHGQTYVALSRCTDLEGLYLTTSIRREDIIVDQEIVEFMKRAEVLSLEGGHKSSSPL